MSRVTIALLAVSTVVVLVTFGQGLGVLRGGDLHTHLRWAMASLLTVLAANLVAMIHAAQSDRIIRELRRGVGGTAETS
jgi:hypothetical protein